MPRKSRFVHTPSDIPTCEHWAIIGGDSVTVPGDERSRIAPGHGYPEHTEHYATYEAFVDEGEFIAALEVRLSSDRTAVMVGIHVDKIYTAKTVIKVIENDLQKR